MEVPVTAEFRRLCRSIADEGRTAAEWSQVESDDMFQAPSFSGGFDADEVAFCFSYYDDARREYWFQLTLDEVSDVAAGCKATISVRPAE